MGPKREEIVFTEAGGARSVAIWTWLRDRCEPEILNQIIKEVIDAAQAEMKTNHQQHWVGGFALWRVYDVPIGEGRFIPLAYCFEYLVRPPSHRRATQSEIDASFAQSFKYFCILCPDPTDENEIVECLVSARSN